MKTERVFTECLWNFDST